MVRQILPEPAHSTALRTCNCSRYSTCFHGLSFPAFQTRRQQHDLSRTSPTGAVQLPQPIPAHIHPHDCAGGQIPEGASSPILTPQDLPLCPKLLPFGKAALASLKLLFCPVAEGLHPLLVLGCFILGNCLKPTKQTTSSTLCSQRQQAHRLKAMKHPTGARTASQITTPCLWSPHVLPHPEATNKAHQ